ncbi:MAG: glycoside hydrolase family 3 C-terminal domain-containing protein [Bacteroidetes bacterium]|nr:glycoside hydrolase family 3 C-terminal domain-containing protein [Bacteroidota bacterium]
MALFYRSAIILFVIFQITSKLYSQQGGKEESTSNAFPFHNASLTVEERVNDLISRLTVEEKAHMMLYNSPAIPRLGIPAYNWWNECLHGIARNGRATVFPQAIALAATFDTAMAFQVANAISDEARAKHEVAKKMGNEGQYNGLSFWTPNINIFRDPRWGRGQETYGEDPFLTGSIGAAFVKGLQGNSPKYLKVAACAKHFAVHSGPEPERHRFNAIVDEKDLRESYLPAFKMLVDAGVEAIMCAYNRLNDQPCCGNNALLRKILREEWNFGGHIVTDCWALDDIWLRHKVVATREEAATMAVKAGVNLNCGYIYDYIPQALEKGMITEQEINKDLIPLMRTRFRLGLFDPDNQVPYTYISPDIINCDKHRQLARKVAARSIVLLKNNNHLLPLKKDLNSLLVTGPLAADVDVLMGNYNGMSGEMVTVLEGILNKVSSGTSVQYTLGTQLQQGIVSGTWQASSVDATIAVIGNSPLIEGEEGDAMLSVNGGDRSDIQLPANQVELIRQLREKNQRPIILVVMGGSCISLGEVADMADAVIFAWYPGEQGGNAVADILFGDENPSGRLPVTFYKSIYDLPAFSDYNMKGRTYRYFEGKPLYPFGFGLSYTTFDYSLINLRNNIVRPGEKVNVEFTLANTGNSKGEEVVQLYISRMDPEERDARESLKAFERVSLNPGESRKVILSFNSNDLMTWNLKKKGWELRPGVCEIRIGASSEDIRLRKEIMIKEK